MVIDTVWKIGEAILKDINRPHLVVEEIKVCNYMYPSNLGDHYRRFLIARIRNVGNERAENCLAHLETPTIPEREFKLHWVDLPYEPRRDSAQKIDLEPQEAMDLDIVFSVCGKEPPKIEVEPDLTSGTIYFTPPEPRPSVTQDPNVARGTYDPSLFTTPKTNGGMLIDARLPANIKYSGVWVANPYALYNPDGYREAFLSPGIHKISVDILLSKGTGCGFSCTIRTDEDSYNLSFDPESVKIP